MQLKKVRLSTILNLAMVIILIVAMCSIATFSYFFYDSTIKSQIIFAGNINVSVNKGYYPTESLQNEDGYGEITYNVKPNIDSTMYNNDINAEIYPSIYGKYSNLLYQTNVNEYNKSPDLTYKIAGEGNSYLGFEILIKYNGNTEIDLTNPLKWNIYPVFDKFSANKSNGDNEFYCDNAKSIYSGLPNNTGFMMKAPVVNGKIKKYEMFLCDSNKESTTFAVSSQTPTVINFANILKELRFAIKYKDTLFNNAQGNAPLLVGKLTISITCKAGVVPVFNY